MPELSTSGDGPVRPGAMTAVMRAVRPDASAGPRWLRWAVVSDGRIVREAVSPPDRAVTLGADGDVPGSGRSRTLLAHVDGRWVLRATPGLRGRTEAGPVDGARDVPLSDAARARLELPGGAVLLVQVVARPPAKLRPQLPASLVGGLWSGADWWFTSFVAASFCLHLGVVAYLLEADWPIDTQLVPDRYAEVIFPETFEPPDDRDTPEMDEGEGDEIAENEADEGDEADSDAPPSERRADRRPSRPSNDASSAPTIDADAIGRQVAEQLLIAGIAPGSANSAFDALRDGASTESAASVFDVVEGTGVATNDVGVLHEHDGTATANNTTRGLGDLGPRGVRGAQEEGRPIEEVVVNVPRGVPTFGPPEPDDPHFDVRELIQRLRGRMPAVRRCYDHVLTHGDPDAAGRITLEMQVMPPGHLAGVRAAENSTGSDALGACIVRAVQTVRVTRGPEYPTMVDFPIVLARQN